MASMSRPGSSDTSRKRRRNNNNNNNEGNNYHHQQSILPEIPGVPIDVVPYLVEALKLATKVFQKSNATSHSRMKPGNSSSFTTTIKDRRRQILTGNGGDNDNDDRKQPQQQQQQNSLHASLMNRVETATQQPSDAAREEEERVNRMNDAVEKWLGTLKRFARGKPALSEQQQQQQQDDENNNNNNNNKAKMMSVPYACFVYLWQLQQDHPRVPVRRAALFLSGPLLQKSRDCRFHLEQDSNLSTWLSNIVVVEGGGGGGGAAITWKNPEQAKKQLPLLQKEAYWVLSYLVDEGYADELYPKIGVAKQRLAQQCPDLNLEDSADVTEMTIRRQRRDIALKYGEKETKRVRKIVQHCENCLEILVPRIGVENNNINNHNNEMSKAAAVNTAASTTTTTTAAATVEPATVGEIDEDDDDDDDIDWDDGDDFGEEEEEDNQAATTTPKEEESNHLAAVERTLAAMQSAGGLLRDGGIEIDLAKTDAEEGTSTTGCGGTPINMEVLSKLEKHVKVLAGRHLPRLTRWLDGLINADNLVLRMGDNASSSSSSSSSLSLISLPSSTGKRRRELVDQLSVLKQEASSILSSATRLDIQHDNNEESAAAPPPRPALRPDLNSSRNTSGGRRTPLVSSSLSSRAKKQQQRARQQQQQQQQQQLRSNRVEIKLRK